MCARRKNAKGEFDDYGCALVGEPQIYGALEGIASADLRIGVMHHPFDWLAGFDRDRVESQLMRSCHFVMRGHRHSAQVQVVRGTMGECVVVPAGAAYEQRGAADANAYNLVHLDLEGGEGVAFLRRWSDKRGAWIADADTCDGGCFPLAPLPGGLGRAEPRGKARRSDPRAAARRLEAAEDRYCKLLLESCDIVSLANLPEQDRHVVRKQRELELRGLFIPLHAWVVAGPDDDAEEIEIDPEKREGLWRALEERRAAAMRGGGKGGGERQRVPVAERLAGAGRLVILGDPGGGKTTLARWLATAYLLRRAGDEAWRELPGAGALPDEDWLPVVVRCRDLDQACLAGSLDDILGHTLRKAELSEGEAADVQALLRARIKTGRALLMLDGLDEIPDPRARARFCEQLERIVTAFPDAPIIATSRIVGYREMGRRLGRGFEHVTLADLEPEEKDGFIRRWCTLTELPERAADATGELVRDVHSAERIERLTGNPMLLTTMALVKRKVGKLPNRRAELYWEAVQVLLNWRSEVDEPLNAREALPQLEYLAYAMCDGGVQQLRRDQVLDLFARMREEYPKLHLVHGRPPEEFLQRLEARTGILIEAGRTGHLGREVPVYEFRHLTFQEYLAARALVDGRYPGRDPACSLAGQVAPLAGRTAETAVTERGPEDTMVVESWREPLRLCVTICHDDDVDDLLLAILDPLPGEPPATARARAVLAALCLADEPNVGDGAANRVLRGFAFQVGGEDGESRVRTGADTAAMELASTRWAGALRGALVDEFRRREAAVRWGLGSLVGMIGTVGIPRDGAGLDDWLAEQARRIGGGDEEAAIEAALCVMAAAFREKACPVPGLAAALLGCLSGSPPLAHAAAWALAWLNDSHKTIPEMIWHPVTADMEIILGYVGDAAADAHAVRYLAWILKNERDERAVEPLVCWLECPVTDVRRTVVDALGTIGGAAAVAPVVALLEDGEASVRAAAAYALGEIKSQAAVAPLVARLEDEDAEMRKAALGGLARGLEEMDRTLLSRDLDGLRPFLDPREPIGEAFAEKAAARLDLAAEEVRARYEPLAERFHLTLAWQEITAETRRARRKD